MIRIDHSSIAPTSALIKAQAALDCDADRGGSILSDHDGAWLGLRGPLFEAQSEKCAYCEDWLRDRMIEIDHIRPKARYWWLAFKVRDLLATCRSCNNVKSNKWQLRRDADRLPTCALPWNSPEPSMLVDPTLQDPEQHLTYVETDGVWRIAAPSDEGAWTIDALGLDRDSVRKDMNLLVRRAVGPAIVRLREARTRGDRAAFEAAKLEIAGLAHASALFSQLVRTVVASQID